MLKIKDSVDLKELEQFGFKFRKDYDCYVRYYFKVGNAETLVDKKSKIIKNYDDSFTQFGIPSDEELLEDLIKADMVEKVEE